MSFLLVGRSSIQRPALTFFYSLSPFPSLGRSSFQRTTEPYDHGNALFPPPSRSFHLFRSRHRMARGDELSLLPPLFTLRPTPSLCSLVDARSLRAPWQIRPLNESTRRYLDISTGTLNTSRRRIYSPSRSSTLMNDATSRAASNAPSIFVTSFTMKPTRKSAYRDPLVSFLVL